MSGKRYCGINKIPKGMVLGSPEYCLKNRQVRYYGLHKLNKDLLKNRDEKKIDYESEKLKLRKIQDLANILVKDVKHVKIILDDKRSTKTEIKNANKKLQSLLLKRDKLVKRLRNQRLLVNNLKKKNK